MPARHHDAWGHRDGDIILSEYLGSQKEAENEADLLQDDGSQDVITVDTRRLLFEAGALINRPAVTVVTGSVEPFRARLDRTYPGWIQEQGGAPVLQETEAAD